ncbi:MAG TPA: tetratricopeptide repeat protein [Gammaproteobacteria bacterium]
MEIFNRNTGDIARHDETVRPGNPGALWFGAVLLACLVISGCAAGVARHENVDAAQFLHDGAFPRSAGVTVESREDVFGLDREIRDYLDLNINAIRDPKKRGRALLDEIFHQASMNLSYDSTANTTASQTFRNRAANCLSLAILSYAMAEHVGFDATFQEVDIPAYWERRNSYSLMNRHVNLTLTPKYDPDTILLKRHIELEVDFQPLTGMHQPSTRPITQFRALAMFYNNKAIDALLTGRHDAAYAYLKAALLQDPTLDMVLTNLGLLYGVNGHLQWAEESYRQALVLNDDNVVSAENLARLLKMTDRQQEADVILARLKDKRDNNPYYFYIQGEEAYDAGNWRHAIRSFEKAIALKPDADQFYFGLARTYAQLGDGDKAETYLRRAERYANYADLKQKYRNKIAALSDL